MDRKAAIQLSANFLVVMIISIVILTLGIALFRSVLTETGETTRMLDERIKQQIENLLMNSGEKVVLPINRKEVSSGDSAVFGLGVVNVLGKQPFRINAKPDTCFNTNSQPMSCSNIEIKGLDLKKPIELKHTERKVVKIIIDVDEGAKQGTYVFNANVCYDDGDSQNNPTDVCSSNFPDYYGKKNKIYLTVK